MNRPAANPSGDRLPDGPAFVDRRWQAVLSAMRCEGNRAGRDAAEWWAQDTIGGRASGDISAVARRILAGLDDGDPLIVDRLPSFDSSIALADLPGDADLINELGADPDRSQPLTSEERDEAVAAYAVSYDQAVLDHAAQLCRTAARPDDPSSDEDGADPALTVGDPVTRRTRVLSRGCDTCIFRPGNLMHLSPGRLRELVAEAAGAGRFIVCHSTLPGMARPGVKPAVCRGFADRYDTQALQIIARLFGFDEIDPPAPPPGGRLCRADQSATATGPQPVRQPMIEPGNPGPA